MTTFVTVNFLISLTLFFVIVTENKFWLKINSIIFTVKWVFFLASYFNEMGFSGLFWVLLLLNFGLGVAI